VEARSVGGAVGEAAGAGAKEWQRSIELNGSPTSVYLTASSTNP
jgi:hypothetical protein